MALGPSSIKATRGCKANRCPIITKRLIGSNISDANTDGKICVPVAMSQPVLKTDHVHNTSAIDMARRTIDFRGLWKQINIRINSVINRTIRSAIIQDGYSLSNPVLQAWKSLTASVQNRVAKIIAVQARGAKKLYKRRNSETALSLLSFFDFSIFIT